MNTLFQIKNRLVHFSDCCRIFSSTDFLSGPLIIFFQAARQSPGFPSHDDFIDLGLFYWCCCAVVYRLNIKYCTLRLRLHPARPYW